MDPVHSPSRPPRTPLVPPGGVDLHERDMTATFSADVTLSAAQEQLARANQWLPVDGDPAATLGRLVDINSSGPLRLGYGAWRDLLLGVQFTNGRGEVITAGGRTVKNVAGYDLTKFMVGQHGVFGRLVTLTTRTYRRPAGAVVATFDPSVEKAAELLPSPLRPQWMALTPDALVCGYLGDEPTLAFYLGRLPAVSPRQFGPRRSTDDDAGHRQSLWCPAGPRTFRASVPPSKVIEFARLATIDRWAADAVFGVVVGDVPAGGTDALVEAAAALGGTVTTYDRDAEPVRPAFSRMNPQERDLLMRLKQAFDPENVLAPLPMARSS